MDNKYQNKYRIPSSRLENWDYGSSASYFVTICTKNREYFFGDIVYENMKLSNIGKITKSEWLKTFEMRPDMNLKMGEFVVMPNHFHAIIFIGDNQYNRGGGYCGKTAMQRGCDGKTVMQRDCDGKTAMQRGCDGKTAMQRDCDGKTVMQRGCDGKTAMQRGCDGKTAMQRGCDGRDAMHCVSTVITSTKNKFGPQSKNLASIIRGFKIGVTKNARIINQNFAWQPRFHDHIIRNEKSYQNISKYIINNPLKWQNDRFHPDKKEQ